MKPAKGFGSLTPGDLRIGEVPLSQLVPVSNASQNPPGKVQNLTGSMTQCVVARTVDGASTVVVTLADPYSSILNSGIFNYGLILTVDGLNFAMVSLTVTYPNLQLTFEAATAYDLRKEKGAFNWKSPTDLQGFFQYLLNGGPNGSPIPGASLNMQPGPVSFDTGSGATASSTTTTQVPIARGTTSVPTEDSWTCMNRLADSAGYRIFECEGVITCGSDTWLLTSQPSAGTIQQFSEQVQTINGTADVGMPLGQLTVSAMTTLWPFKPGQPITVANLGPMSGVWLVYSQQRNAFEPQATITLQRPMTAEQVRLGLPTLQYV